MLEVAVVLLDMTGGHKLLEEQVVVDKVVEVEDIKELMVQ
jgi:hypothetical protein